MKLLSLIKNPYRQLERKLGYAFHRRRRLIMALSHPSYRFETNNVRDDNQRLEYLGDAALGLVVGHYLFVKYPDLQEGALTSLRSRYTSGEALAQVGHAIGLGDYLLLGKGERLSGGHRRDSNVLDAMEAILGAAYLDGGLKAVSRIFKKVLLPAIAIDPHDFWGDNPKGQLQALAQKRWKAGPKYEVVGRRGPSHALQFQVRVSIAQFSAAGEGPNKREAERQAAARLLSEIDRTAARRAGAAHAGQRQQAER